MIRLRQPSDCYGFTLIEVILALGILAISLAMISTLVQDSFSAATQSVDKIEARMVAESVIDQMKCGAMEVESFGPLQLGTDDALSQWAVQVVVEPTTIDQLVQVRVYVGLLNDEEQKPACEIVRWFQSEEFKEALALAEAAASTASTSDTEEEEE